LPGPASTGARARHGTTASIPARLDRPAAERYSGCRSADIASRRAVTVGNEAPAPYGLAVPAVLAAAAAGIDALVLGFDLGLLGWANYLLVWGALHQLGFAWRDQTLTRSRWLPVGLTFFPSLSLIAGPFHHGLVLVLAFAAVMCLVAAVAAVASWLRGRRFVHEEAEAHDAPLGAHRQTCGAGQRAGRQGRGPRPSVPSGRDRG
jgi:hypothetical protein